MPASWVVLIGDRDIPVEDWGELHFADNESTAESLASRARQRYPGRLICVYHYGQLKQLRAARWAEKADGAL